MWTKPNNEKEPVEQDLLTFDKVFKTRPHWHMVSALDRSLDKKNMYRTIWLYDNKKNSEDHLKYMKSGYYGKWIDPKLECVEDFLVNRKR